MTRNSLGGLVAIMLLTACKSNSTGPALVADFYVQAGSGNDANPGTSDAPFKTITHALSVAAAGNTIQVLPGRYDDVGNGETFPLVGPPGVILLGDEKNKGGGATPTVVVTTRASGGSVVFEPPANAVIAGFTITDSAPSGGDDVDLFQSGDTVRNNRMANSSIAMRASGSTGSITDNVIMNNDIGMILCNGTDTKVERNTITNNQLGVAFNCAAADLGGGTAGSAGGNVISCNSQIDVEMDPLSPITVSAANNRWDHAPPTEATTSSSGLDVYVYNRSGVSTVTATGAALAPSPCP